MEQRTGHGVEIAAASPAHRTAGEISRESSLFPALSAAQTQTGIRVFLAVGVALRLVRFLLPFPLWFDEFQVAENLLDRDYLGLTRPLNNIQVAPIGFLWIVHALTQLLGFHEWSLRVFPCLCGIASLFLMRQIASRLLTGTAQVLAVAILAVSYYPIRLGSEVKPYAGDLMCSLLLLACVAEWFHHRRSVRWLWGLCACIVPALMLSFPAVFIGGTASVVIGTTLIADRVLTGRWHRSTWGAFALYNGLLLGTFAAITSLNSARQFAATADDMLAFWADTFPPLQDLNALALWLLRAHTGEIFAVPIGSENGGSFLTTGGCLVGVAALWRRGPRWLLAWGGLAFLLNFAAAALQRYPYGGHARLAQHLVPLVVLGLAAGVGGLVDSLSNRSWQARWVRLACAGCLLLAVGTAVRDIATPYKSAANQIHQGFARWFWQSTGETPIVCVEDDLERVLYGKSLRSAFRCYREIYQPRGGLRGKAARDYVANGAGPVRCVVFHSSSAKQDRVAFAAWRSDMENRYTLAGQLQHVVVLGVPGEDVYDFHRLCYDVYDFVPTAAGSDDRPDSLPLADLADAALDD